MCIIIKALYIKDFYNKTAIGFARENKKDEILRHLLEQD